MTPPPRSALNVTRRPFLAVLLPLVATTGALALGTAAQAAGTTQVLSFHASDDAYTSTARPAYNDGTFGKLVAGTQSGDTMVTFLKFTVGALPTGTTAEKATLTLTRDEHHLPGTVKLAAVADTTWSEKTLTARTAPKLGAVLASTTPASTAGGVTFDVSSVVRKAGTYSFAVTDTATSDVARFRSDEYGTDGPTLQLTVAPSVPSVPAAPTCTVTDKLVPTCNILWGAAAGWFTSTPRDQALKEWEAKSGRTASIYHTYHVGDELFPTAAEIAMASDATRPRLLFTNWKVSAGTTWARAAAGADGVTNVVFVLAYMSYEKWFNASWWGDLYPGDDVVDWIGVDAYLTAGPTAFHNGSFSDLMDRTTSSAFPGFYGWATTKHPGKPVMLAEWGVYENTAGDLTVKPAHFNTVLPDLSKYPALKAMLYFDAPSTQSGGDLRIDSSPAALTAFQKIAADPRFNVRVR